MTTNENKPKLYMLIEIVCDDEMDYVPSSTRGDYSPSCPWTAPGMSMSDFI